MLRNTFIHLPGVGPLRERSLWEHGIRDWDAFLVAAEEGRLPSSGLASAVPLIRQSQEAVRLGDAGFFKPLLPPPETWRLFGEFAERAVFLDIETTGLSPWCDEVTMIGTLAAGRPRLFIRGVNLEDFPDYVEQFPLLVTFNGSQFDVPFLRAHFPGARLDQPQIDLRFVLASLGYRGGLKTVERSLGLSRDPAIQGVDGFEAVRLWRRWRRGDPEALRRLALYNLTDVANLVELLEAAVERKCRLAGFPAEKAMLRPCPMLKPGAEILAACIAECCQEDAARKFRLA